MKKSKLFLALAALMFAACPTGNDDDGGGGPTTPPDTVLPTPNSASQVSITGNTAYYYGSSYDSYKGVFIEGRTVTLSPFYIAKYETTYELWYEVYQWATDASRGADIYAFANPGREGHDGVDGAEPTEAKNEPVTNISWRDAVVWCNAYSEKSGKEPVYYTDTGYATVLRISTNDSGTDTAADKAVMKPDAKGWRLPTEAEWEYAARGGGTPSPTAPFTDKWAGTYEYGLMPYFAWYGSGTQTVGTMRPNGLGLFDMSGNVLEWCWDRFITTVSPGSETDPTGPSDTSQFGRVIRGGSWKSYGTHLFAVTYRMYRAPEGDSYYEPNDLGFRVVARP
jgi:formylglycine-generating enzyme required for sulfatase activity